MSVLFTTDQYIQWDLDGAGFTLGTSAVTGCWMRIKGYPAGWHQGLITLSSSPAGAGTSWEGVYLHSTEGRYATSDTTQGSEVVGTYQLSIDQRVWVVGQREGGTGSDVRIRVFADDVGMTKLDDQITTDHAGTMSAMRYLCVGDVASDVNSELRLVKFVNGLNWSDAECRTEAANDLLVKAGGDHRFAVRLDTLNQSTSGLHQCCGTQLGTVTGSPTTGTMTPTNGMYAPLASDDFTRANETPLAAPYTDIAGGFATAAQNLSSNAVQGTAVDGPQMYDGGVTWPDDQWAEIVTAGSGNFDHGIMLRSATGVGYVWFCTNAGGGIRLAAGGSFDTGNIDTFTPVAIASGHVLRFQVQGTTFRVYQNGDELGSATDAGRSSGKAGLFTYDTSGVITAWAGGRFGSPPASSGPSRLTLQWRAA